MSYGPNSGSKYITTYFRRDFEVEDPTAFTSLLLRLVRDDGAVVYLNGQEIARSNMPEGAINSQTLALSAVGGADESTFYEFNVPTSRLREGRNVLAVEIHQNAGNSSDLSFDLSRRVRRPHAAAATRRGAIKTRAKNGTPGRPDGAQFFLNQTAGPGDLAIT